MYAIKENGRDGSIFYDKEMTEAVSYKLAMQNELQLAIQVDQFVMVYQAVIDLQTDSTIGAEALVRWNHPKKGLIGPNEFLSFLDESNMSIAFGYLVIQKVCKDLSEINTHLGHSDFKIAINLDAKQFFEPQLLSFLLETCQKHKVFPEQIELELLETSIMNRHCLAQEKFDALKEKGFSIAIDDFGTGYSSLSYLKNFQVDKLKIDHSFIRDCLEDPSDKAIVEAIIRLANIFSLKVYKLRELRVRNIINFSLLWDVTMHKDFFIINLFYLKVFLNFMHKEKKIIYNVFCCFLLRFPTLSTLSFWSLFCQSNDIPCPYNSSVR